MWRRKHGGNPHRFSRNIQPVHSERTVDAVLRGFQSAELHSHRKGAGQVAVPAEHLNSVRPDPVSHLNCPHLDGGEQVLQCHVRHLLGDARYREQKVNDDTVTACTMTLYHIMKHLVII
jgi:hypothetical protein